jgi:hypothetical protein
MIRVFIGYDAVEALPSTCSRTRSRRARGRGTIARDAQAAEERNTARAQSPAVDRFLLFRFPRPISAASGWACCGLRHAHARDIARALEAARRPLRSASGQAHARSQGGHQSWARCRPSTRRRIGPRCCSIAPAAPRSHPTCESRRRPGLHRFKWLGDDGPDRRDSLRLEPPVGCGTHRPTPWCTTHRRPGSAVRALRVLRRMAFGTRSHSPPGRGEAAAASRPAEAHGTRRGSQRRSRGCWLPSRAVVRTAMPAA